MPDQSQPRETPQVMPAQRHKEPESGQDEPCIRGSHLAVRKNGHRRRNGHPHPVVATPNGHAPERAAPASAAFSAKTQVLQGDARNIDLPDASVDLVVTSPPYWKKRDYRVEGQIGQEASAAEYVAAMVDCLREWRRVLRPSGSVFLNIGDTFFRRSLAGIPARVEAAADPSVEILQEFLDENGMADPLRGRVIGFFRKANHLARTNPFGSLGHTYFRDAHDEVSLQRLWRHQLRFLFEKAYQLDLDGLRELQEGWDLATAEAESSDPSAPEASDAEATDGDPVASDEPDPADAGESADDALTEPA